MAKKKATEKAIDQVGIEAVDISPERIKRFRHFLNYSKKPYISTSGFRPEITEEVLVKMEDVKVLELYKVIFTVDAADVDTARARILKIIVEGR